MHAAPAEHVDQHGIRIPISSGIPTAVRVLATIGLIAIFIMGGIVIGASRANHVWPAADSTKIDLGNPPTL